MQGGIVFNLERKSARVRKNGSGLSEEDKSLVMLIESLQSDMEKTNSNLDYETEPLLIDGYIYELKSLTAKYEYCIKLCKERGLVAGLY